MYNRPTRLYCSIVLTANAVGRIQALRTGVHVRRQHLATFSLELSSAKFCLSFITEPPSYSKSVFNYRQIPVKMLTSSDIVRTFFLSLSNFIFTMDGTPNISPAIINTLTKLRDALRAHEVALNQLIPLETDEWTPLSDCPCPNPYTEACRPTPPSSASSGTAVMMKDNWVEFLRTECRQCF